MSSEYHAFLKEQEQAQGNLFFLCYFLALVLFGGLLYDLLGLTFIDELFAFGLLAAFLGRLLYYRTVHAKPVIIFLLIAFGYLLYAMHIRSNVTPALLSDLVSQSKPYLGFLCTLSLGAMLSQAQKDQLAGLCWFLFVILLVIGIGGEGFIRIFFGHPSRFASMATIVAMIYLYCAPLTKRRAYYSILLLSVGLFSTRAKFIGFFTLYSIFVLCSAYGYRFKFTLKHIFYGLVVMALMLYVVREKINFYFIEGVFESEYTFARPLLYMTSASIFLDYFPLGSGLASFASHASSVYYSETYYEYGLNNSFGLGPDGAGNFISDAFFPSLAQFGVVGVCLFFSFFIYILYQTWKQSSDPSLCHLQLVIYLGVCFFMIESIADTTFTHNRGLVILVLMATSLVQLRKDTADLSSQNINKQEDESIISQ